MTVVENGEGSHTYAYRPDGLRQSKTVGGVTTTHIWDGQNIAAELEGGTLQATYIRGINLLAREDNTGTRRYYLYNAHGDVTQLTDHAGSLAWAYDYDAFGNQRPLTGYAGADSNPFRYCGEYLDSETGTYYLRARYYDPVIGRFLAEDTHWNPTNMIYGDYPVKWNERQADPNDPLSLNTYTYVPDINAIWQSSNLYGYCGNNPVMYVDSDGEWWVAIGAIVGMFIGGGIDLGKQLYNGKTLGTLDWTSIIISAGAGALSGAFGATGIRLLGQIFVNAAISGTEAIVRDVVYGNKIDWKKAAINTGIGALAGGLGGAGLKNVATVSYGRIVSAGTKMGIYTFTYTSSRMAETMAKEFVKGTVKGTVTVEVINNVVNIMVKER